MGRNEPKPTTLLNIFFWPEGEPRVPRKLSGGACRVALLSLIHADLAPPQPWLTEHGNAAISRHRKPKHFSFPRDLTSLNPRANARKRTPTSVPGATRSFHQPRWQQLAAAHPGMTRLPGLAAGLAKARGLSFEARLIFDPRSVDFHDAGVRIGTSPRRLGLAERDCRVKLK